jgi:hypothetical protein
LLGHASVQITEPYLGCKQNLGQPVNDLFQLGDISVAAQASFWCETDGQTKRTGRTQLDKISINESIVFHDPTFVHNRAAARQAQWLEKVLAEEHERERKRPDRIELPD